ncbi:Fanconi anemia core complex-associated protein 100 isoform X2 [Thalassophryne amazonica]|uniref:Fanconi anemia core complex-associated protein 100 isoform X2 n=1 Tax=Thalassophryne amazonica TaxID=390379 RepID=UPI00147110F1|nr:Fanconi anemia core complex-associated protein 100 isoform X2 [Thalassophryne amazonica]
MEGRRCVETLAHFGCCWTPGSPIFRRVFGTDVLLCLSSSDQLHVFSLQERKLKAVLLFPSSVSDLVWSHDKRLMYVACKSGVYCVQLQSLLSRFQSSSDDASSGPAELKISSEGLAVGEDVLALIVASSMLLTVSQRDAVWLLSVYKTSEESGNCESLCEFSLPLVSAALQDSNGQNQNRGLRKPVLVCIHCSDQSTPFSSSSSSSNVTLTDLHIHLKPLLFKLVFGIDAALAKSPVIMCGLPDGRLCFFPLRLPGSQLRVLHSLEQPVIFIGASALMETGLQPAQYLVAVGELGRVVLISTSKAGLEGTDNVAGLTEGCVPGPVACGCVDERRLFYSTGSDLLVLDLAAGSDKDLGSSKLAAVLQSITSLNVCRVIALAADTHNVGDEVQLVALSARGQLQRLTLPIRREDKGLPVLPSTQQGRSIKDLLSSIGDVCERASALKSTIKSKNQTLRILNQVLNISYLLLSGPHGDQQPLSQQKPIRCYAVTSWNRLLQKDSLNLTCVLDNKSPYVLDGGWTLSLTVFPLSHSHNAGHGSTSRNFSFPFASLPSGEKFEVSLPLAVVGDVSFPFTMSCLLIFSLTSLVGEEEVLCLPGSQGGFISLPLNTLTVDWMDALQVSRAAATHTTESFQPQDTTVAGDIRAFVSSRRFPRTGKRREVQGSSSNSEQEQYSANIRVSSELLQDTLGFNGLGFDPKGLTKSASPNLCSSLLKWLLSEGPGGGKMEHQGGKISLNGSEVRARAPNGHRVKLTAKEVIVGEQESLDAVEIQLESSSVSAVCGMHHAVLCRLQSLLQNAPEKSDSTKSLQSLAVRCAVQRAERLLQQIQQSRVTEAFDTDMPSSQMTRSLFSVYRELRENPLLII